MGCRPNLLEGFHPSNSLLRFALIFELLSARQYQSDGIYSVSSAMQPASCRSDQRLVVRRCKKQPFPRFRAKGCFAVPPKFRACARSSGTIDACRHALSPVTVGLRPTYWIVQLAAPRRQARASFAGAFHRRSLAWRFPAGPSSSSRKVCATILSRQEFCVKRFSGKK